MTGSPESNRRRPGHLIAPLPTDPDRRGTVGITLMTFWPLAVGRTLLEWSSMMPDWGDDDPPELGTARLKYFDEVMGEDTASMAPVQRALRSGAFPGMLTSYNERRIYRPGCWAFNRGDRRLQLGRMGLKKNR
jgi:hypothetical protein